MREGGQFVFVFALFAADVQIAHVAEAFLEGPVLFFIGLVHLISSTTTSIVYQTVPPSISAFVNFTIYFGSLFIG
jgi:hypothetical protein